MTHRMTPDLAALPPGATCPKHPGAPAVATCRRCGTFVCAADLALLDGAKFCQDCAARPDVDYLEAFRLKYWGQRDAWAWFFGVSAVLNLLLGGGMVAGTLADPKASNGLWGVNLMLGGALVAWAVISGAFWAGARWSRPALLFVVGALGLAQVLVAGPAGLVALIFPLLIVGSALINVRTKLFFKMNAPRDQLKKQWALLHDNVIARNAFTLGFAGLAIPIFAPLALVMGVIGVRRVDPTAYPPIGRKGYAIAGIVTGALGTLGWTVLLLVTGFAR